MQKKYENSRIAVDAVVFTVDGKELKVLLFSRKEGLFELSGGILRRGETADQALKRKLKEYIGSVQVKFRQFFTFTDPRRDLRVRTVSIGYVALVDKSGLKGHDNWHGLKKLPRLAFDHEEIIKKAREFLKTNSESVILKQSLPRQFSLNKLQGIYEIVQGEKQDNRNFRKKMISSGFVIESKKVEEDVAHRPAKLFKFS
jgi:8-oxo-dGTP diphosphatase